MVGEARTQADFLSREEPLPSGKTPDTLILLLQTGQGRMMTAYDARLRLDGTDEAPISVLIDLTDDRLSMMAGEIEVGDWARNEIRVSAMPDGFHMRAEGEEIILDVTDDARFALDLGLRNAPPLLRRRMSALLRNDGAAAEPPPN
jgi:hypothetical protein